jgi:hypothetical protein
MDSTDSHKSLRDQAREIRKLILDAQEQLDLALRGLRSLEERLAAEDAAGDPSDQRP